MAAPSLRRGESLPKLTGILMFPAMLLGPSVAGLLLTWLVDGRDGLRALWSRLERFNFAARYWLALLIPPILVLGVLSALTTFVSASYAPNRFWIGIAFGIPAGFLEEIGWMGFAYSHLRTRFRMLSAAVILGVLWGLWHAPVIDFLGAASPHGKALPLFFVAFVALLTAMRILIAWLYDCTQSLALCQLMHISSTGALVIFGPPALTPIQESLWYGCYAAALWLIVTVLAVRARPSPGE